MFLSAIIHQQLVCIIRGHLRFVYSLNIFLTLKHRFDKKLKRSRLLVQSQKETGLPELMPNCRRARYVISGKSVAGQTVKYKYFKLLSGTSFYFKVFRNDVFYEELSKV